MLGLATTRTHGGWYMHRIREAVDGITILSFSWQESVLSKDFAGAEKPGPSQLTYTSLRLRHQFGLDKR